MDNAKTSWVKMKYLFLINSFSVALTFGQIPISKPPSFPPVAMPDFNASESNKIVPEPPKRRSSQVETISQAEIDLRHGKEGERVGAAKLLGKYPGSMSSSMLIGALDDQSAISKASIDGFFV